METGLRARPAADAAADPRSAVAELVSRQGPVTATALAEQLGVTPAAVRRHLDSLAADGLVDPRPVTGAGPRGRGRPARAYVLSSAGQDRYGMDPGGPSRDEFAESALHFLDRTAGREAVAAFARERAEGLRARVAPAVDAAGADLGDRARALAGALDGAGYAASARPALTGTQLCQGRCPVHRVAAAFPELCEAEAAVFAGLLGAPVQRLATLAGGAHVCTTHVGDPRLAAPTSGAPAAPRAPRPTTRTDRTRARPGERTMR